jgi:four helix bundle protein
MEKTTIKTYQDLIIWQKSIDLVTQIYIETKKFPLNETYGLILQMRKSAISIPSNIAEGYGRNSTHDYLRFLNISKGSLYELETQLLIACNLKFIPPQRYNTLNEICREIEGMLSSLIKKLKIKVGE